LVGVVNARPLLVIELKKPACRCAAFGERGRPV
jgi:hypothetical protein